MALSDNQNEPRRRKNPLGGNQSDRSPLARSQTAPPRVPYGNVRRRARQRAQGLSAKELRQKTAMLTKRLNTAQAKASAGAGSVPTGANPPASLDRLRARLTGFRNELSHDLLGKGANKPGDRRQRYFNLKKKLGSDYEKYFHFTTKAPGKSNLSANQSERRRRGLSRNLHD